MKYKAILITAIALATSVNAIELSGGVSADTKQSDYLECDSPSSTMSVKL
jgi:hypothetical protein